MRGDKSDRFESGLESGYLWMFERSEERSKRVWLEVETIGAVREEGRQMRPLLKNGRKESLVRKEMRKVGREGKRCLKD
jgi:hypothetical protein